MVLSRIQSLPVSRAKLCLAKFTVLILLAAFQMAMSMGRTTSVQPSLPIRRTIILSLSRYMSCKNVCGIYAAAIPMAAIMQSSVFSVGIGLASIVPFVLMINTKKWFAYPMSYPFYLIMVAYGRAAEGVYETQIAWLPAAVGITVLALARILRAVRRV